MKVKLTKHLLVGIGLVLVSSVVVRWLDFHGAFAGIFGPATQLSLHLRSSVLLPAALPPIVTVAIDDSDYKEFFNKKSPLEPCAVMALVNAIREKQPLVLGVDILTDGEYFRDKLLHPSVVPTLWVASVKAVTFTRTGFWNSESEPIAIPDKVLGQEVSNEVLEPIVNTSKKADWALPVFAPDDDGVVRRFPRRWLDRRNADQEDRRIFAREIADAWSRRTGTKLANDDQPALLLPLAQSFSEISSLTVGQLFAPGGEQSSGCQSFVATDKLDDISKKIVLLGGTFDGARDRYASTLGIDTPGLILNAMAVRAEIVGPHLRELSTVQSWVLDLVSGLAVVFLTDPTNGLGSLKAFASVLLACLIVSLLLLLYVQIVWISWTLMVLAGVLNLPDLL